MQPTDLLFQAFSNLTGGVINDLTTVMVAMVGLMVLLWGARKIMSVFEAEILEGKIELAKLEYDQARNGIDSVDDFEMSYRKKKVDRLYGHKLRREGF